MSIRVPRRLPRGVKENDPRLYFIAESESEAEANVAPCEGDHGKLNQLLTRAAYHDDVLTARAAIKAGADPNYQNLLREGPMPSACAKGSIQMLRTLLEHGATLGHDKYGVPPLIHAVRSSRSDLVAEMITAGADVNAHEDRTLSTALHIAAANGDGALVKLLLKLGADPREVNAGGQNVLVRTRSMQEHVKCIPKPVFRLLERALPAWRGKPLPRRPRRRPRSQLQKLADETVDNDPGGP